MTVNEWREKHKRCEFCKHMKTSKLYAPPMCFDTDIFECKAKQKTVHPKVPRPFCRVFQLKED